MDVPATARLLLRLAHALAAVLWLGGGAYYVLALRPAVRSADPAVQAAGRAAQREFGEWASVATLILIATGVILTFDRLTNGRGTVVYVILLAIKIVAALIAFGLTGTFVGRSRVRRGAGKTVISRSWLILGLGTVALIIGITLSAIYPTGIGQR
ncbi:MAG TPA: copper resistance protein CopD [Nitrolancea sp.]|nr:copper resistance protein CopD [Nitrolancea sp.]